MSHGCRREEGVRQRLGGKVQPEDPYVIAGPHQKVFVSALVREEASVGLNPEHVYSFLVVGLRSHCRGLGYCFVSFISMNVLGLPAGQQLESCCCQQLGVSKGSTLS